jgi:hypothetical protein
MMFQANLRQARREIASDGVCHINSSWCHGVPVIDRIAAPSPDHGAGCSTVFGRPNSRKITKRVVLFVA